MKQNKPLLLMVCLCFFCYTSLVAQVPVNNPQEKTTNSQPKSNYTSTIFQNADKTFGYDILENGKRLIHQPSIPGRPGNKGFKTQKDAEKVVRLAIDKIKQGILPPTIEEQELQNAGI